MLNTKELRMKTENELFEEFKSAKKELQSFVAEIIKGKEKNTKKAVNLRKHVARVQTVLNEKLFMKEAAK